MNQSRMHACTSVCTFAQARARTHTAPANTDNDFHRLYPHTV